MRNHENEPFVVNREVRAVIVPAGVEVTLKPGQSGYITQALGGSFTEGLRDVAGLAGLEGDLDAGGDDHRTDFAVDDERLVLVVTHRALTPWRRSPHCAPARRSGCASRGLRT